MVEPATPSTADGAVPGFDLSTFKLLSQGAEAVGNLSSILIESCISPFIATCFRREYWLQRVWEGSYLDLPAIIKQRFSKKYRHPSLDKKITHSRLKQVTNLPPSWRASLVSIDQSVRGKGQKGLTAQLSLPEEMSNPILLGQVVLPDDMKYCRATPLSSRWYATICLGSHSIAAGSQEHSESSQAWGADPGAILCGA